MLHNQPLANAPPNKDTRDLPVEKRVVQQGVGYHPSDYADVVVVEVVRSAHVKKNRVRAYEEM